MDTNRKIISACLASLALIATGVQAQTIYKQVDEEGRVIFTDQPAPGARTITSFESSRPRAAPNAENAEWAARAEASRRPLPRIVEPGSGDIEAGRRNGPEFDASARPVEGPRRIESEPALSPETSGAVRMDSNTLRRPAASSTGNVQQQPQVAVATQPAGASSARNANTEVERAVSTYTPLNTPMAAQADAVEAARRARQEASNATGGPILVVQATPREQEPAKKGEGMDTFYWIWVITFFALAAGLLYVGWQVFRLILGTAFPRWKVGVA